MSQSSSVLKVAVSQHPPQLLNLGESLQRAIEHLRLAAQEGAKLIMFPEAYLPGYPTWIWRLRPGGDWGLGNEIHARLRENSVDLERGDLDPLCEVAKELGVVVIMGMNEVDNRYSGTTLFNTVVVIDADGTIVNRHRKLMPTNPERMVWGMGDASGLRVVETAVGRVGTLICWESYMPLSRFALYAQNIDIYAAPTWDSGATWHASMMHIAREAGCWVLSSATALKQSDIPEDFPGRDKLYPEEEWVNPGDAVIVKPSGALLAGPLHQEAGILYGEIDLDEARNARKPLDVAGHYARHDIFHLEVDRREMPPVHFWDGEGD